MARCCRQHLLTSPSTFVGVGRVPRSVQYLSRSVTAHRPVVSRAELTARIDLMPIQRQDLANSLRGRIT